MPWDADGNWVPEGALQKTSRAGKDTGVVAGSQGIGTVAGGYQAPPRIIVNDPTQRAYTERGLPIGKPRDMNVFGERPVLQGAPLSAGERAFWAAHPGGASASEVYGFDPTGPGTAGRPISAGFPAARSAAQVDADSLINQAISRKQELEGQRLGLENQRHELIRQYGLLPTGRHGRTTAQHKAITEQLKGLADAERGLRTQEHFAEQESGMRLTAAFRNAELANKSLDFQRKEQTARDAAAVMSGLSKIESTYKHGTPEFRDAITQLTESNPMFIHSSSASAAVRKAAEFHDTQEQKRTSTLQTNLQKQTGLSPEEFAALDPSAFKAGQIVGGAFSNDATRLLDPKYKDKPWEKIPQAEKDRVNKIMQQGEAIQVDTGKGYSVPLMRVDFENYRRAFGRQIPNAQQVQQPQPAQNNLNISSDAEYQQLPSGSIFIGPDGVKRRKP